MFSGGDETRTLGRKGLEILPNINVGAILLKCSIIDVCQDPKYVSGTNRGLECFVKTVTSASILR